MDLNDIFKRNLFIYEQAIRATSKLKADITLDQLESSWKVWVDTLFPNAMRGAFAPHHVKFWDWVWSLKKGVKPRAFVSIWPRGGAKSTSIETACVLLAARRSRTCILYVSGVHKQACEHLQTIATKIESSGIEVYYPDLATRQVNKYGSSKGWAVDKIRTKSGLSITALGLDVAARGIKIDDDRPDLIVLDDIDEETDSPAMSRKKFEIITKKLLPCGSQDFAVVAVQNLIHADSVFARLADPKRADFLATRIISGPIPALKKFKYEMIEGDEGRPYYKITSGVPTWEGMNLEKCEYFLNEVGPAAFLTEYQHEVKVVGSGAILPEYDEFVHVITWSEFVRVFGDKAIGIDGRPTIPYTWSLGRGLDFGTTLEHPTGVVWVARPPQSEGFFGRCVFLYRELVRPSFPPESKQNEPVSPARIAALIRKKQQIVPIGAIDAVDMEENRLKQMSLMSHEQSAVLNTFIADLNPPLYFRKWRPDRSGGIPQLQNYLEIDWGKVNPFRRHPETGEPLQGRPRLYIIVDDEQGDLYLDEEGELRVRQARGELGFARLRWEIPRWHYPSNAQGVAGDKPDNKIDDDMLDGLRGLATEFFPMSKPLSTQERVERSLPTHLQQSSIEKAAEQDQSRLFIARQIELAKKAKAMTPKNSLDFLTIRKKR